MEVSDEKKLTIRIYLLPNLLTTANLFFGFYSMILALKAEFIWASYAIVAAAVFDLLDGRVARITRSTSKFGAQYDSLCDLISFCMAPALLLYLWSLEPFGRLGWIASFFFLACGALRLARFNVQADIVEKAYFQGLPTPMAAGIVASSVLAFKDLDLEPSKNLGILLMTFGLALVMISTIRYRSFKDIDLRERLPFTYLVIGVAVLGLIAYRPEVNLFLLFLFYATLGAVFGVFKIGFSQVRNAKKHRPHPDHPDLVDESQNP